MKLILSIATAIFMMHACSEKPVPQGNKVLPSQREVNKGMENINRQMAMEEDAVIEGYCERRAWDMIKTGTGLRYMIYHEGPKGPMASEGMVATVAYEVSLIDGTVVYSSDVDGIRSFLVGQDNVETGIHEVITYLKVGDKARVILPSHLAHGLSGDNNKIPPRSTVIYDLELISLR